MKHIISGLLCIFPLACTSSENTTLDEVLLLQLEGNMADHRTVLHDLNADGIEDAIVYMTDPYYCGSAGCTMLVFQGTEEGYTHLSSSTIVQLPLSVVETEEGWKDLIVYAKGTGLVRLKGSEQGYPLNPSMQPLAEEAAIINSLELLNYE